jgi:hypothetical protein
MSRRNDLVQLARLVANDLASGSPSPDLRSLGEALASSPGTGAELIRLIGVEARKKRSDDNLVEGLAFMIGETLQILRYGVDQDRPDARDEVAAIKALVERMAQDGSLAPDMLLLLVRQFVSARLDPGDTLRAAVVESTDRQATAMAGGAAEIDSALVAMARQCRGDAFALQAELSEQAAAYPDGYRAAMATMMLASSDATIREASVGWLLDAGPQTRRTAAERLGQAAGHGRISSTMLRRLILIRNWLVEEERALVDTGIRIARQAGIEIAPAPAAEISEVIATAIDGAGSQSFFVVVRDGRKHAVCALLLKRDHGVADAWVNRGLTRRAATQFLGEVAEQTDCFHSTGDHLRLALADGLATSRDRGQPPPFGLVDVVERSGLATIQPEAMPAAALIERLLAALSPDEIGPAAVDDALAASAEWEDDRPSTGSWFEADGAVEALLSGRRLTPRQRIELVIEEYLPGRRARWAAILAWSALTLRQDPAEADSWPGIALVARELLAGRPLARIPVIETIARNTVEAWEAQRL